MVQEMNFADLEELRAELGLGVNAFLKVTDLAKSSYYRKKRAQTQRATSKKREGLMLKVKTLCEAHPCLGYRPIHALLRQTCPDLGCSASTVYRVMKALGLCQKSRFC